MAHRRRRQRMSMRHAHAHAGWPAEDVELFVGPPDRSRFAGGVFWTLRQSSLRRVVSKRHYQNAGRRIDLDQRASRQRCHAQKPPQSANSKGARSFTEAFFRATWRVALPAVENLVNLSPLSVGNDRLPLPARQGRLVPLTGELI
jgi:hypothetical protein